MAESLMLSEAEKNIIRSTWSKVILEPKLSGIDLFLRFFSDNPSYQKLFKSFSDIPFDELRENKRLAGHATQVIYAVSAMVDELDDTECVAAMLVKLTKNHERRKITVKMFENLGTSMIGFLIEKLGEEEMNDEAVEAWKKMYTAMVGIVSENFGFPDEETV